MDDFEQQIRAYAKKVAEQHLAHQKAAQRDARIGIEVANIILRAGGSLRVDEGMKNLLAKIYRDLIWKRDGHK